jgi:signal transduction histidine kinase
VARARARAQDLAHALKTPLTALRIQAQGLEGRPRAEMEAGLSLLSQAVGAELARAQLSTQASAPVGAPAEAVVDRLWGVLARAYADRSLAFDRRVAAGLALPMTEEAALEAFGGLLDNAARHAGGRVAVTGGEDGEGRFLSIADDGPGIPEPLRARSLDRGARLETAGGGQGLGLAIAADFIEASGGRLILSETPGGGLTATARWPRLQTAAASRAGPPLSRRSSS